MADAGITPKDGKSLAARRHSTLNGIAMDQLTPAFRAAIVAMQVLWESHVQKK
jgi:hypothetical protein